MDLSVKICKSCILYLAIAKYNYLTAAIVINIIIVTHCKANIAYRVSLIHDIAIRLRICTCIYVV